MAEIATGNPYDAGGAGSGVGAVMFTPNHKDITDIGAAWNAQNAADEAAAAEAEKEKLKNARLLVGDLNLDTKGALDSDAPYLRQRIADITNRQAELYKQHNGNPTSVDSLTALQNINADKNIFGSEVNQSAGHKEQLIKAISALDADKTGENYDKDATALNIAKFRASALPERQKMLDEGNGSLLVQQAPFLSKVTKNILAHPDKSVDSWEKTPIPNVYQQNTMKTHSPERIGELARVNYADDRNVIRATDDAFAKLPPAEQARFQQMSEQKQELEQRVGKSPRVITPQESFLEDYLIQNNPKDVTTKVHNTQFNPFDLAAYKHGLKQQDDGESYLLQQGANTQNGVASVFDKEPVAKRTATIYNPADPASINNAVVDATGNPIPNANGGKLNPDEYGIAPFFTGAKNGTADVAIPMTVKGANGKVTQLIEKGKPVFKYSKVDNNVRRVIGLGEYDADGNRTGIKPLVADARSLVAAGYAPDAPESEWKDDPKAYATFDKGYLEGLARNNGVKDERMSKFFKSVGGYGQRITDVASSSDPNARRIGAAQGTQTTQTPQPVQKVNAQATQTTPQEQQTTQSSTPILTADEAGALKGYKYGDYASNPAKYEAIAEKLRKSGQLGRIWKEIGAAGTNPENTNAFTSDEVLATLGEKGYDVSKLAQGAPAAQKKSAPTKEVPISKLQSLVGTKGYEGYTLDELKQYYRSQGYTVK